MCVCLTEILSKLKSPPPLCRPTVSADEAPLEVIQVMKQAWSEEPDKRPTFEEIFKQVAYFTIHKHTQSYILYSTFGKNSDPLTLSTFSFVTALFLNGLNKKNILSNLHTISPK